MTSYIIWYIPNKIKEISDMLGGAFEQEKLYRSTSKPETYSH